MTRATTADQIRSPFFSAPKILTNRYRDTPVQPTRSKSNSEDGQNRSPIQEMMDALEKVKAHDVPP